MIIIVVIIIIISSSNSNNIISITISHYDRHHQCHHHRRRHRIIVMCVCVNLCSLGGIPFFSLLFFFFLSVTLFHSRHSSNSVVVVNFLDILCFTLLFCLLFQLSRAFCCCEFSRLGSFWDRSSTCTMAQLSSQCRIISLDFFSDVCGSNTAVTAPPSTRSSSTVRSYSGSSP